MKIERAVPFCSDLRDGASLYCVSHEVDSVCYTRQFNLYLLQMALIIGLLLWMVVTVLRSSQIIVLAPKVSAQLE